MHALPTQRASGRPALRPPADALERVRSRVSDAPRRSANRLTVLENGPEAYEEWLTEIDRAQRWIHLENYLFKADGVGRRFVDVLKRKASEGLPTRVLYDWWGSMATPSSHWEELRAAGVHVREFNPFSVRAPLGAALRDHRKSLVVDGEYASVGGICIADAWAKRSPVTGLPYRDTAMGIRGPAVADVSRAFRQVWGHSGSALPAEEVVEAEAIRPAGEEAARVVIQEPGKMRIARMLQLVAAVASERLWIADAYFMAGPALNQALMSAARDGVDVRLLLPATNDVPLVSTISRSGYRPLLEAGVRIFEYGGLMMHAKTSVADGASSRVGSTNLNVTGLLTDWELDVVVEGESFGLRMEEMFERDLADSREMLLRGTARRPRAEPDRRIAPARRRAALGPGASSSSGSAPRAFATAARAGEAAFRGSREDLERHERLAGAALSGGLLGASLLGLRFPRVLAWPLAAAAGVVGGSGVVKLLRPERAEASGGVSPSALKPAPGHGPAHTARPCSSFPSSTRARRAAGRLPRPR